jgi:aspartate racemase
MEETKIILGIFGGMGPEATARFFTHIIELTPAETDQDHIPTLIYSLPQVPDRTESIKRNDPSIIPWIIEGVTRLEIAGASFIAIPCNTVHYYFDQMQEAVQIPILHMIRETVTEIRENHAGAVKVGLLATEGTIESGLYENELEKSGLTAILPDQRIEKEKVMKAISGIKSGSDFRINQDLLAEAAMHLLDRGAELILLGCTEIPLAFDPRKVDVPVIDASRVLAGRSVRLYTEFMKGNQTIRL